MEAKESLLITNSDSEKKVKPEVDLEAQPLPKAEMSFLTIIILVNVFQAAFVVNNGIA